jgi:drug/metabolite transporter (DMT)-like permease
MGLCCNASRNAPRAWLTQGGFPMLSSSNLRGIISMVVSGVTFVSCDSFLKMLLRDVPPMEALVLRGLSATVWCFLLVLAMGHVRHLLRAFDFWIVLRAMMEVIAVSSFIFALAKVPLGDITAIYQVAPLLVLAGASFLWGEHIGPLRWMLIVVGLGGALLVAQPGGEGTSSFALLGFITAFGSAARDLLSRKTPDSVPGIVITFSLVVCVLLVSGVNSLLFETWVPVQGHHVLYALGAGFFVTLGHLFVFLAFRHASARAVAPFYYSFTLAAVTFGAVLFNEWPNGLAVIGILMIIACGIGVLAFERKDVAT